MLDPMLTLIAAKARAVGLVAGTAMVTTALVGGGAVAMTAVNAESDLQEDAAVEQVVEGAEQLLTTPTSDTGTVGIDPEEPKADKPRPPLPTDFSCDQTMNHGQNVSAYARSLPKGPGRGEQVSAVAQSDCGKTAGDDESATDESATEDSVDDELGVDSEEAEEAEVEKTDEQKSAKKAEQAQKKADRKSVAETKRAGKGKK